MAIITTKEQVLSQLNPMFHTHPNINALLDHFNPKGEQMVMLMCAVNTTLQMVADNMNTLAPDNSLRTCTEVHKDLAQYAKDEGIDFGLSVTDIPMDMYSTIISTEASIRDEHEHEEDAVVATTEYYDELITSLK